MSTTEQKSKSSMRILASPLWQKDKTAIEEGSRTIFRTILCSLQSESGCLIGRHGTIEMTMALLYDVQKIVDMTNAKTLEKNAGVFPYDKNVVKSWLNDYKSATQSADVMAAGWYAPLGTAELNYLNRENPTADVIPLRSLEPWYSVPQHKWTRAFEGHRVCVVSSFAKTMKDQLEKREGIWGEDVESYLPGTTIWSFVRSYYCPSTGKGKCEWPFGIKTYHDAIEYLVEEVLKTKAKIVLIGCGALGMILGDRLKAHGKVCIVLGGAIQLLFGIKGLRWEKHPEISELFTDSWVYSSSDEIPGEALNIEGGCYW